MTSIITTLTDFENLIIIAKKHGLTELKLGDICFVVPPQLEPEKPQYVETKTRSSDEIDAEIYGTMTSI